MKRGFVWFIGCMLGACPALHAQVGADLFSRGRVRVSATGGYQQTGNRGYGVIGLGLGYYLIDGLEAGVDSEAWFGSKPNIYTVSPQLRYVLTQWEGLKPYIGAFYQHSFYQGLSDLDAIGGRAGAFFPAGSHAYLGAGLVYEKILHCDAEHNIDCSAFYPEAAVSFSF